MKKKFFIFSICSIFCTVFIFGCRSSSAGRHRDEGYWVDTTWTIPQNDSIIWKHSRIEANIPQGYTICWYEGDTLHCKATREAGPSVGRIFLNGYKDSSYKEIKKDTIYNVEWRWKADASDTVMFAVVNTSSVETLQIKVKISKIYWHTDPGGIP